MLILLLPVWGGHRPWHDPPDLCERSKKLSLFLVHNGAALEEQ
jgi:hypothetical protein